MHRFSLLLLGLLMIPAAAFGQTSSADSKTLQTLLQEVRQLRQDLQSTTVAVQRIQILLHRLDIQEAAVTRASQRLDDARSKLAAVQASRKRGAADIKRFEEVLREHTENNSAERKQIEDWLSRAKPDLEASANEEQLQQAREAEAEDLLRNEQAKLEELQERLDELDRALEKSSTQPGGHTN
jgi:chromosome segregation ATPase